MLAGQCDLPGMACAVHTQTLRQGPSGVDAIAARPVCHPALMQITAWQAAEPRPCKLTNTELLPSRSGEALLEVLPTAASATGDVRLALDNAWG